MDLRENVRSSRDRTFPPLEGAKCLLDTGLLVGVCRLFPIPYSLFPAVTARLRKSPAGVRFSRAGINFEAMMSSLPDEVRRRRTFAIISHPDAGKTTLTEKLLLYGGAIHLAGSDKA